MTRTSDDDLPTVERTCVLSLDDEPTTRDREAVQDALARLAAIEVRSLAPLVSVSVGPTSISLTHRVPAHATTLEELRARGPLRVGHVLHVAVAVCDALVALHDAGLAHGAVGSEHVLVGPDGSVVLSATGAAWRRAPGAPDGPHPGDDVEAVGDLVRDLLGAGSAPASLVIAALRASDPDPFLRPAVARLREAFAEVGPADPLHDALWAPVSRPPRPATPAARPQRPERPAVSAAARGGRPRVSVPVPPPLRTSGAEPAGVAAPPSPVNDSAAGRGPVPAERSSTPGRRAPSTLRPGPAPRRRRRVSRRGVLAVAAGIAVTVVAGAALARAEHGALVLPAAAGAAPILSEAATGEPVPAAPRSAAPAAPPVAPPAAPVVDWSAVLAVLDSRRRAAIAAGSTESLAESVDPAGAAWTDDAALVERVRESGARMTGGELVTDMVRVVRVDTTTAVLRVRDRRTAYEVVVAGRSTTVAERPARWWTVTLSATPTFEGPETGWRVSEVSVATDEG